MRQFPIMVGYRGTPGPCPSAIPWEAIAPYEGHALENHQQTLEKLASRGGLDPVEAYFVMTGHRWKGETVREPLLREACAFLDKVVKDWSELQAENTKLRTEVDEQREAKEAAYGKLYKLNLQNDAMQKALEKIRDCEGAGLDGSPPSVLYDVAVSALAVGVENRIHDENCDVNDQIIKGKPCNCAKYR